METLTIITVILMSGTLGALSYDWHLRLKSRREMEAAKDEMKSTTKAMSEAHNNLAQTVMGMQDQVNAMSFREMKK